jgi:hypothetical protein
MWRAGGPFGHVAAGQFGFVKALVAGHLWLPREFVFYRNSRAGPVLQGISGLASEVRGLFKKSGPEILKFPVPVQPQKLLARCNAPCCGLGST